MKIDVPPLPEDRRAGPDDIAVYFDGSGRADWIHAWNLKNLAERLEVLRVVHAFSLKYKDVLAGLNWKPDLYDAEIEIDCVYYRRERTDAATVARMFPELEWKRVETPHGIDKETVRDWMAHLDGVDIRIRKAEVFAVVKPAAPWAGKGKTVQLAS